MSADHDKGSPLILIADDDLTALELTRSALESSSFTVVEAADGEEALRVFHDTCPDLVMLDVMMPKLTGFDVCAEIRTSQIGKNIPVVMVTGLDDSESIDRAYDVGATDFITKPINWSVIGYRVRYILRSSRAEAAAATAHARLNDAIECFPASFRLFDGKGRLVTCNERARIVEPKISDLLVPGTERDDIVRGTAESGVIAAAVGRVDEWLAERAALIANEGVDYEEERTNGRWFRVIERRTTDGGQVEMHLDITDSKTREVDLYDAKNEAELANRAKSEFLANMSHELRTPLNAIIGFTDLIRSESYGPVGVPEYHEFLGDIKDGGEHLLAVINDMLDMSKIESGKLELAEQEFDLVEVVNGCIRLIKGRVDEAGIVLRTALPTTPMLVLADPRLIKQTLLNLLSNAAKFTRENGEINVVIGHSPGAPVTIVVRDTGIGIAEEDMPRALAPFMQVETELDRSFEGTGLGLPLAVAMTELHGGTLTVTSEPGVGTEVLVELPATRRRGNDRARAINS